MRERERTHGAFYRVADKHAALLAIAELQTLEDVVLRQSLSMILLKIARISAGDASYLDHWRDIAGYAELVIAELAIAEDNT